MMFQDMKERVSKILLYSLLFVEYFTFHALFKNNDETEEGVSFNKKKILDSIEHFFCTLDREAGTGDL